MSQRPTVRLRVLVPVLLILVILNVALIARLSWPLLFPGTSNAPAAPPETSADTTTPAATAEPTAAPTSLPALPPDASVEEGLRQQGVILLSLQDGAYAHLFAYNPRFLPLTRLSNGQWDDLHPAISPDGTRVAFTSRQSGFWDLSILDLRSGEIVQLTSTPDYDGAPTWSPDGAWLAYESYANGNMDIYLCSVTDLTQPPIRLTDDPAPDYSPDWSPAGRELVFVSSRSGEDDVWLLKLDSTTLERFTNLSHDSAAHQTHPAWSLDGRSLVWSSAVDGLNTLQVWDSQNPDTLVQLAGYGVEGVWDPSGQAILAQVTTPNQNGLAIYTAQTGLLEMPVEIQSGEVRGMDWQSGALGDAVLAAVARGAGAAPEAVYQPVLSKFPISPAGRYGVVAVEDVQVPYAFLHDAVDESFRALRQQVAAETGWDFLGSLENAFLPLTQPSAPGMEEDWLYTGRAFNVNPVLTHAGWMALVREEMNGHTYWRVYLKARYQDGSQGIPLTRRPWDLDARYNGDAKVYEQGGQLAEIPQGYWIDFTELAGRYGWERQPALVNWLTYYPATRFNQFVLRGGLDWSAAMAELYPPEALSASLADSASASTPAP
jgi:TolB protein